jgi:hypothetical protein
LNVVIMCHLPCQFPLFTSTLESPPDPEILEVSTKITLNSFQPLLHSRYSLNVTYFILNEQRWQMYLYKHNHCHQNSQWGGSKMVTGSQTQTAWAPWIRDLAETLETHVAELKHQGELKLWHLEPLAHGMFLHTMIHWKE